MRHVREARQGAVRFEHVADGDNGLGDVGAVAYQIQPTELVCAQAESRDGAKRKRLLEGIDSKAWGV